MTETQAGLPILASADARAFADRLATDPKGGWLKFAKPGGGAAALSKSVALDRALRHGWIDAQLARYDEAFFLVRFAPRRPGGRALGGGLPFRVEGPGSRGFFGGAAALGGGRFGLRRARQRQSPRDAVSAAPREVRRATHANVGDIRRPAGGRRDVSRPARALGLCAGRQSRSCVAIRRASARAGARIIRKVPDQLPGIRHCPEISVASSLTWPS